MGKGEEMLPLPTIPSTGNKRHSPETFQSCSNLITINNPLMDANGADEPDSINGCHY